MGQQAERGVVGVVRITEVVFKDENGNEVEEGWDNEFVVDYCGNVQEIMYETGMGHAVVRTRGDLYADIRSERDENK